VISNLSWGIEIAFTFVNIEYDNVGVFPEIVKSVGEETVTK